jgi:DNA-binding transcriptional LysR family regulator
MLDLRRLRLLRELDARGTVGAAAAALGYTPSAVSQQLAVLEREAGVALLQRAGRNVRLTDAGRVLVVHAAALQDGVEAAEAALAASAATIAGSVRIAAFQTAMLHIVTPAIAALAISHPAVRVEVVEAEVEEALGALTQQRVDVLIGDEYGGLPRPRARGLRRETLLREQIRLVLPAAHPLARRRRRRVALAALRDAAWAAGRAGTSHREMVVRACRSHGDFEPDLRHASNDLMVLLGLVRRAGAVALLPDLVGAGADESVVVRDIAGATLPREVFALTRTAGAARPALVAVRSALREAAAVAL